MAKAALSKDELEYAECVRLNELARLYPWKAFTQAELRKQTGYPEAVISAAFADPEFPQKFRMARPEQIMAWVESKPAGIETKQV